LAEDAVVVAVPVVVVVVVAIVADEKTEEGGEREAEKTDESKSAFGVSGVSVFLIGSIIRGRSGVVSFLWKGTPISDI
jgi:hypothetical protein